MTRNTPVLTLAAFATLALAACQDGAPTAPRDGAAPLADKGGNGKGHASDRTVTPGASSAAGVAPTAYGGNTPGDGNATCTSLGGDIGSGVKIDGAASQQIAGYQFTVSGEDNAFLSFAPVAGRTPTSAITAVFVKGGPAYDVYRYTANSASGAGVTSDSRLTAPYNRGGNVPGVSHYVVCSVPLAPRVEKKLIGVMTSDGHGGMTPDKFWSSNGPVIIPKGETRWLQFEIKYYQPDGASGTLTENGPAVCGTLGAGFGCSSPNFDTKGTGTFPVTGSGSKTITLDVTNNTCAGGTFTNTVTLGSASASASVTIQGQCVDKQLTHVFMKGKTNGMTEDPTYHDGKVTIPQGQTRWLEYEISYNLPAGVSANLSDDVAAACATLGGPTSGFTCSTAGFEQFGGQTLTVTGSGSRKIIIDITNDTGCGDRDFTNTAVLARMHGPTTSASSKVMIWTPACNK